MPRVLTLYQAEWCPFSAAVRERLTELGVDYIVRQVPPWPEQREELEYVADSDEIPILQTEDGNVLVGTRAIFAFLEALPDGRYEAEHRARYAEHHDARQTDASGRILEKAAQIGERAA